MNAISNFAPRGAIYVTTARNTVHAAAYTNADGDPMSVRLETFEHDTPDLVLSTRDGRTETADRVSVAVVVALLRAAGYHVTGPGLPCERAECDRAREMCRKAAGVLADRDEPDDSELDLIGELEAVGGEV